jgi:hypothetical protein
MSLDAASRTYNPVVRPANKHLKESLATRLVFVLNNYRLNVELDLQSLFGLLCTAVLIG